jgi:hypothetical protein
MSDDQSNIGETLSEFKQFIASYYYIILICIVPVFIFAPMILLYIVVFSLFFFGMFYVYVNFLKKPKKRKPISNDGKKEVFQIANRLFTYESAKNACSAYNSTLATKENMNDAYKNGADWCTLGWSADQHVYFPTQQSTVDRLKKYPGHELDCGYSGVNGGAGSDPEQLFGANCYGVKPVATTDEQTFMDFLFGSSTSNGSARSPDIDWSSRKSELLLLPFNNARWNA